ncbi:MAG: hypothetical protein ABIP75_07270 [Pyrinomonadaceae bacterium]
MMDTRELWEIQMRITRAQAANDFDTAFEEIGRLIRDDSPGVRMTGLYYRGEISESQGALADAVRDWKEALDIKGGSGFLRFELCRRLAVANERLGEVDRALASLRSALQICSEDGKFSGNLALTHFLRVSNGAIDNVDQPLIEALVVISWQMLEVPDPPDLNDLPNAIAKLDRWFDKLMKDSIHPDMRDTN